MLNFLDVKQGNSHVPGEPTVITRTFFLILWHRPMEELARPI